jgi:two-component system, NtrC family, sensor histidine kinase HydH
LRGTPCDGTFYLSFLKVMTLNERKLAVDCRASLRVQERGRNFDFISFGCVAKVWDSMVALQVKRMYLPALAIVGVVFLLLVFIGLSTYRNINREKTRASEFVHWEGFALIQSFEAAVRVAMLSPTWGEATLRSLLQETAKNAEIVYIFLVAKNGTVLYHTDSSLERKASHWVPQFDERDEVVSRVERLVGGTRVYEMATRFPSLPGDFHVPGYEDSRRPGPSPALADGATLVFGLKMTAVEEAERAELSHALIMAAILFALGGATLFFLFVIHNYYVVNKTLKETQDYTAQVVANIANGLLSVDPSGRVVSYNRTALELLGVSEGEIRGMDLRGIIDFEVSGIQQTLDRCEAVLEREISHRSASGEVMPVALSVTPIVGEDGRCRSAVIVLRDLRQIKRLEEEVRRAEKLAAVGELAAGVAHEIRNPLSSIRGLAQFLRRALAGRPKEREYAELMVKEVDRINRVVTDLLTLARPQEPELAPTELEELLDHTVRLVQADAARRGVNIHKIVARDLPKAVMDESQITQALLNLLLNALQAMEQGGTIEVGANVEAPDSCLHLWVEDGGPGIPAAHMGKIFEPFFTTRVEGTGLGLAIVQKIVANHRGEIRVESPPQGKGRGTRFNLYLPLARLFAARGVETS